MNVLSQVPSPPLATVKVLYNNSRIVPAPLITFQTEPIFDDAGTRTATRTRLNLESTLLILPSGSYEQIYTLQEDLRTAFSVDYKDFIILAGPANKTLAEDTVICSGLKPRVLNINIDKDVHVGHFNYSVELEDITPASGVSGVVSSFSNQWNFREDSDTCTLQISHTVSAQGVDGFPGKFQEAVTRVKNELGIDKLPIQLPCFTQPNASGEFSIIHPSNPLGGPIFEVSVQREEVADVANGSYSATEIFIFVSGVPFFFPRKEFSFQEDENGIATVTVQGEVQGLGRTNTPGLGLDGGVGFQRACSGFLYQVKPFLGLEASGVYEKYKTGLLPTSSGLAINSPESYSVTENRCRGTIGFSITFSDDPDSFLPSGIASRQCSVNRRDGIHVFAYHPIPLRRLGPIRQDINTTTPGQITIQCNAVAKNTGDSVGDTNRAILFVQDEVNRLRAIHANSANFITLTPSDFQQNTSDIDLSCSVTLSYDFTIDLGDTISADQDITLRTI